MLADLLEDGTGSEWVGALSLEIVRLLCFSSGTFSKDIKYLDTPNGAVVHALHHEAFEDAETL